MKLTEDNLSEHCKACLQSFVAEAADIAAPAVLLLCDTFACVFFARIWSVLEVRAHLR